MPIVSASSNDDKKLFTVRLQEQLINEMRAYCDVFGIIKGGKHDFSHFITESIKKNILDKERDKKWLDFKKNQDR